MKKKISRRSFSKKTATALTATSLLGIKAFPKEKTQSAKNIEYDYVVVGSGAGGGPLACNLARHGFKVLVLEAGSNDVSNYINEVPSFHAKCSEDPNFSWHYFVKHYSSDTQAQKDSKYVSGKGIFYPRGATIGGSTINNAMITVLPHDSDFDHIAQVTGDWSWSASNMKKYRGILDKSFYLNYYDPSSGDHERDPWLPVRYPDLLGIGFEDPMLIKILTANVVHNKGRFTDFLVKKHLFNPNIQHFASGGTGAVLVPQNTNKQTARRHAVREYLLETARLYPDNLTIETDALASRVIIKDKKAVGVEYLSGQNLYKADPKYRIGSRGEKKKVMARREVILAAGAFNSPQLLKLSGIGPRKELKKHGIPVKQHLPGVGRNLQDRYEVGVSYKFKRNVLDQVNLSSNDPAFQNFYRRATGPYTSNGALAGSIIKSNPSLREADLFNFALLGSFKGYEPGYSNQTRADKSIVTWAILKGHTNNTGNVLLRSKNPRSTPKINFKYFKDGSDTNSNDMRAMVNGVKNIRSLMQNIFVRPHHNGEVWPGNHINSDTAIAEFVKNEAWGHHASCTNKIGGNGDKFAVLDSKFRVRGIQNLRVVDASVFPKIPGFFIVMPIYMISEKATDDILETAGVSRNRNLLRDFFKNREDGIKEDLLRKEELSVVCYPNPFKEKLVFDFGKVIKSGQEVNIWLWDKKGTLVRRQTQNYSLTNIIMNVVDLPSGMYVYIIQTNGFEKRGTLIKE